MKNVSRIAASIVKNAQQFKTIIKDHTKFDIFHLDKWTKIDKNKEVIFDSADLTVEWNTDIEERSWGINSIKAEVINVSGTIQVEYLETENTVNLDFNANQEGFTIESEIEFSGGVLIPDNIEIDFATKKVVVS